MVGLLLSMLVGLGVISLYGGPTQADAYVTQYTSWAVAHGSMQCAYPTSTVLSSAPLYPWFAGGLMALDRVGHSVPFPSSTAPTKSNCAISTVAERQWSARSGAFSSSLWLGYSGLVVLLLGVLALLRASGRGRTLAEPVALLVVGILPPVLMCLLEYFHPQDLVAMGLALGGIAASLRRHWIVSGVLFALALLSQQFALLALLPLLVVVPQRQLVKFVGAVVGTVAALVLPLLVLTSGRALQSLWLGTGGATSSVTVLDKLGLHGPPLSAISRLAPILLALLVAWWARRHLGEAVLAPLLLVSLVATSLSGRLVFEVFLWGYYFMAVAVLLVILDVIAGRFQPLLLAWIALVTVVFIEQGYASYASVKTLPLWLWQLLLVPTAVYLASQPLLRAVRESKENAATHSSRVS